MASTKVDYSRERVKVVKMYINLSSADSILIQDKLYAAILLKNVILLYYIDYITT